MSALSKFNQGRELLAKIAGQRCTVSTPDYTAQDQTPVLQRTVKLKYETTGPRLAQVKAPNVEWYTIFGRLSYFQAGDVIQAVADRYTTSPRITVLNYSPFEEVISFKTSRTGNILNGRNLVYENVYFEIIAGSLYPGSPFEREMKSSLGVPSTQAVMYMRDLTTATRDAEGLYLVETDVSPEVTWVIQQVNPFGNMLQLILQRDINR